MSRPSLHSRPTRDIAGVVSDMLGQNPSEALSEKPQERKPSKPRKVKTEKPLSKAEKKLENDSAQREKTSFALRPTVKRYLTLLKLDLRSEGHRVTEAEIVEALISAATASSVLDAMRRPPLL